MIRLIAASIFIVMTGLSLNFLSMDSDLNKVRLITSNAEVDIRVELARTTQEKAKGLMYRESLEEGQGMLFIYDRPARLSFWMKNTLIPLDMIFIGSDLIINHIEREAPPCLAGDICPTYFSGEPDQYVLEVTGGYTEKINLQTGDLVEFIDSIDL